VRGRVKVMPSRRRRSGEREGPRRGTVGRALRGWGCDCDRDGRFEALIDACDERETQTKSRDAFGGHLFGHHSDAYH